MISYTAKYSELYDVIYHDKDYAAECAFLAQVFSRHGIPEGGRILDLACGTGNHAFELERYGYKVTGVDLSPNMISVAEEKKSTLNSACTFRQGDMSDLEALIFKENYDVVLCLFDSIGFVISNERLLATLKGIRTLLKAGGLFVFDFWHAAAMISNYEKTRTKKITSGNKKILRISETEIDVVRQTACVRYSVSVRESEKTDQFEDVQTNRFFLVQEMRALLEMSGIMPVEFFKGLSFDTCIDRDTWHIACCAKNKK